MARVTFMLSLIYLPPSLKTVISVFVCHPEYCEKYAKPEDAGAAPEEKSSDEEMSEDEYDSSDEAMVGPVDP